MAQYPVTDHQSTIDGLNYVLSGPTGIGKNFAGYSAYHAGFLTGNYRIPFTVNTYTKTARGASGSFTITVDPDTTGVIVGQNVTGPNIGAGAKVASVTDTTVRLTVANTGIIEDDTITFTPATIPKLYVAPIAINNAQQIDSRTIKYTFTTPQAAPPFALGNGISVTGVTPAAYNSTNLKNAGYSIYQIGVIDCTTTYVTVRTVAPIVGSLGAYVSGGFVSYTSMETYNSTDCDVRATINGYQDQVVVNAQLNQLIEYLTVGTADLNVYVAINRYKAFVNPDPVNPDYYFNLDATLVERVYVFTGLSGSGLLNTETNYISIVDAPVPGYYRYILEVYFEDASSGSNAVTVVGDAFSVRSIGAQVIKP
jgi:hypothetical protein